jgi:hypothetical protein
MDEAHPPAAFLALRPYLVIAVLWLLLVSMRLLAGRLAARDALGPLLFLVTRQAVLLAWGVGAAAMFALLLPGALAHGRDSLRDHLLMGGLSAFCGLGFAAGIVGPAWAVTRLLAPIPAWALEPGELLLYEAPANHFLHGESRGGKLLVTSRRVGFRPHRFNVQVSSWSTPLDGLRGFEVAGDRFLLIHTPASAPATIVASRPRELARYLDTLAGHPEGERATANDGALAAAGLS